MRTYVLAVLFFTVSAMIAVAQTDSPVGPMQAVLQNHSDAILKSSRKTIGPAIEAVVASKLPQARAVLNTWQDKDMWHHKPSGMFYRGEKVEGKTYRLFDLDTGVVVVETDKRELKQIKPNSGIRAMIATALVRFQLEDPDPTIRAKGLTGIERAPNASLLGPLVATIESELNPDLKARKARIAKLLTISFSDDTPARVAAIKALSGDLGVDVRGALNPLVSKTTLAYEGEIPTNLNVARTRIPGHDGFSKATAYQLLVDADKAPAVISDDQIRVSLGEHIEGGQVGGFPIARLGDTNARNRAYAALAAAGKVSPLVTDADIDSTLSAFSFVDVFAEPSAEVSQAAEAALAKISTRVSLSQTADLTLDAMSLASIYFLAAIGLAITFGVMGVINMAHGEFMILGAYVTYLTSNFFSAYIPALFGMYFFVAMALAFLASGALGLFVEWAMIRHLYKRPLDTLLATWGLSLILQQIYRSVFGAREVGVTIPDWMIGSLPVTDLIEVPINGIFVMVLAVGISMAVYYMMFRSVWGRQVRAINQNRVMAGAVGINTEWTDRLTFGIGCGVAGVAGSAFTMIGSTGPTAGQLYIVDTFLVVVFGGAASLLGTIASAFSISQAQSIMEFFLSGSMAKVLTLLTVVGILMLRPQGLFALKLRK